MRRVLLSALFLSLNVPPPQQLYAQRSVDPSFRGERLIAMVPMQGTGTPQDPRRPLFAPVPGRTAASGITGFSFQVSDDGRTALVEFVAARRSAFAAILAARRPDVIVFERGKAALADVEREFRKVKPGFDVRSFGGGVR